MAALAARAKKKQGEAGNKKLIPTVFRYLFFRVSIHVHVGFHVHSGDGCISPNCAMAVVPKKKPKFAFTVTNKQNSFLYIFIYVPDG